MFHRSNKTSSVASPSPTRERRERSNPALTFVLLLVWLSSGWLLWLARQTGILQVLGYCILCGTPCFPLLHTQYIHLFQH